MRNRSKKHIESIIDFTLDIWQLSINEEELLESVLNLFLAQNFDKLRQVEEILKQKL